MIPEQFHFLRPWWLLALLPLAAVVWMMLRRKLGSRSWEAVVDPALLPHILADGRSGGRRGPVVLTALCGLLAVLALAGPAWDKLPQPVYSSRSSLVIALDLSRSMDANDITPSRLVRARYKIRDILKRRPEGQTALLVYAGDAFTVTPLTDDTATIASQLNALTTDIMPVQGNRTDRALRHAGDLLEQAGAERGDILLITDEVDPGRAREVARKLHGEGYRMSVLGVGTGHGVPVPLSDGSFLKDSKGQIVIPVLEEGPMRELASLGGGLYTRLQVNDGDIDQLLRLFDSAVKDQTAATEFRTDVWRERGPWLLLLLLPLAALAFRRGYALALLLSLALPLPRPAQAFDWDSLWLRPDQQAARAAREGRHEQAAEQFRDPAWKGVEQYRSGDYGGAAKSLQDLQGADNLYNLGNALARSGRFQAAIDAYDKALAQDPGHADARHNKQVVEDFLKRQQQKQQQQKQQQQKKNGQQQQQDQQQQQRNNRQGENNRRQQQQQDRQQPGQQGQSRQQQQQDRQQQAQQQQQKPGPPPRKEPSGQEQSMKKGEQQSGDSGRPLSARERQSDEEQQAVEQWLRRIPDDPAGLLRRKFRYQYQQRQREQSEDGKTW